MTDAALILIPTVDDVPHIAVRVASATEQGAVGYAGQSWLRTSRKLAPYRWMEQDDYWRDHRATVFSALQSPRCTLLVATLSDDPDLFLGIALIEPDANALHWVQTKGQFRMVPVALDGEITTVSKALIAHAAKRGLDLRRVVYTTAPDGTMDYDVRDTRGELTGDRRDGHGLLCAWQRRGWTFNPYPLLAHAKGTL